MSLPPFVRRSAKGSLNRPKKPSGRHAARLRRDGITAPLSCSFNFLATRDWKKAVADFNILATLVIGKNDWAEKNIVGMKRRMESLLQRFEEVLKRLKELEDF